MNNLRLILVMMCFILPVNRALAETYMTINARNLWDIEVPLA